VVADESPNFVVAFLVRAGLMRVPEANRVWLARELLAGSARRRTAVAAGFPLAVTFSVGWALLNTLDGAASTPAWVGVAAFAPYLVLSMFGLGYRRHAHYLRKKNGLVAEPGDGVDGAARPKPA
jgi:hypothetical protein